MQDSFNLYRAKLVTTMRNWKRLQLHNKEGTDGTWPNFFEVQNNYLGRPDTFLVNS